MGAGILRLTYRKYLLPENTETLGLFTVFYLGIVAILNIQHFVLVLLHKLMRKF